VQGEKILIFRVDAVSGKAPAQPVAAVMHKGYGFDDHTSFDQLPGFGDQAGKAAVGYIFLEVMGRFELVLHIFPHGVFKKVQGSRFIG
jgi:hypothetical protein